VESWEFLAGADPKQLEAALKQVLLLLDACIDGIMHPTDAGIHKAVSVLDFLHTVNGNLVSEIGSTILVTRIIDSLRLLRGALLQLRLWSSSGAMPVAEVFSAGIVLTNFAIMLTMQQLPSLMGEMIVIPSLIFIFASVYLMLHDLHSPFGDTHTHTYTHTHTHTHTHAYTHIHIRTHTHTHTHTHRRAQQHSCRHRRAYVSAPAPRQEDKCD
jgi:hypothetical protein